MDEPVRYAEHDRIATVTLDRPHALNALDEPTLTGLANALTRVRDDASIKAMVITGAGDTFSVGLDIEMLGKAFDDTAYFRAVLEHLKQILLDVESLPVPVVAAVNGLARAGGFELMLACDIALVASEARIGDTHLAFGIPPGGGASARAPRRMGHQRAAELLLTGRWMDGPEAVEAGLALRAVPRDRLGDAVDELVARIRPLSRPALAATKALLNDGKDLPLSDALDLELERFIGFLDAEPTSREGYRATIEKREPRWS